MLETKSSILIFSVSSTFTATNILPIYTWQHVQESWYSSVDNNERYSLKNRPSRWSPMWIIPKTNLVCGEFCRKAGKLVDVQLLLEFLVLLIDDVRYATVCRVRHIYTYTLHYTTTGGLPLSPLPPPIFSYFPRPQSSTGSKSKLLT